MSVHVVDKLLYFHFKTTFPSQVSLFCSVFRILKRANKATLPRRNVCSTPSALVIAAVSLLLATMMPCALSQKSLKPRFRVF